MLDQAFGASPRFVPRLNFATADSELAGISLSWEDSVDLGDHLLVIWKLERVRVALALIDAGWRIAAVLQLPVVLQQCHPDDIVGPLEDVAIRTLRSGPDSFEGILSIEQAWHRLYPRDPACPKGGGTMLKSWNASWYRVKCRFFAGIPALTCEFERTDTERHNVQFCESGESGYWLSSAFALPSPGPESCGPIPGNVLEIAAPGPTGLPSEWRQVHGVACSGEQDDHLYATIDVRSFDRDYAACLLLRNDKPHVALLDVAKAEMGTPVKIPLRAGFEMRLAWRPSAAAGTIWFFIDNNKKTVAKRDWSLWRVDYGAGLPSAKRAAEAMRVTRLSEDTVMTEYAVLDYGPFALAMWQDGMNLKKANVTRCFVLHRVDKSGVATGKAGIPDWTARPADGFLNDLPRPGLRERRWMGRSVTVSEAPQFPSVAFEFGDRFGSAVLCRYAEPVRSELTIGEIVFDAAGCTNRPNPATKA